MSGVIGGVEFDEFDEEGRDKNGLDEHGRNKDGWDKDGLDKDGLDKHGVDIDGYRPSDVRDAVLANVHARVKELTGLSLESAEDIQVRKTRGRQEEDKRERERVWVNGRDVFAGCVVVVVVVVVVVLCMLYDVRPR